MKPVLRGTASLILAMAILACSCSALSQPFLTSSSPTPDFTPQPPPVLPTPPAPLTVSTGAPEQQAGALADALSSATDNNARLAAWLGVYQAIGLPVINEDGSSATNTGDDPVGPPYWLVWYFSGMDFPGRGVTLSDAAHILTAKPDGSYDSQSGQVLLDDLRQEINSQDPQQQLIGYFIRERLLRSLSKVDMLDPGANPDEMEVDPATIQLIDWVLVREVLFQTLNAQASMNVYPVTMNLLSIEAQASAGGPRCGELFGSETSTKVVEWIGKKLYNGKIPFLGAFKGVTQYMLEGLGTSADQITKINKVKSDVNTVAAILSFDAQINSLMVDAQIDPSPLVRTKDSSDGQKATTVWHLYYDPGKLPNGDDLTTCMVNFISSTLGGFTLPTSGDIGGAEISFKAGENIPDKVLFDTEGTNYTMSGGNFSIATSKNGIVNLKVIGAGQKHHLPDSAKPFDTSFTIQVSAQPGAETGKSLVDTFMDSLAFWQKPGGGAIVAPILDLLKTLHYDLGERGFALTDWAKPAYELSPHAATNKFIPPIICDFNQLSTVQESQTGSGVASIINFQFTPTGPDGLTGIVKVEEQATYPGSMVVTGHGSGTYSISTPACTNDSGHPCEDYLHIPHLDTYTETVVEPGFTQTQTKTGMNAPVYDFFFQETADPSCN